MFIPDKKFNNDGNQKIALAFRWIFLFFQFYVVFSPLCVVYDPLTAEPVADFFPAMMNLYKLHQLGIKFLCFPDNFLDWEKDGRGRTKIFNIKIEIT